MRPYWKKLIGISILLVILETFNCKFAEAGHRCYDRVDCVVFGEWQPSTSNFLKKKEFSPGEKLSLKIFVERPGDTVIVKFFIETPGKSSFQFKENIQDNSSRDLDSQSKIIIIELTTIPTSPVYRYIVEVSDESGQHPYVISFNNPIVPENFSERLEKNIVELAERLWSIPEQVLSRERGSELQAGLHTLIVTDTKGKFLNTMSYNENIQSPIWLPDNRLIFVSQHEQHSFLKVVTATLEKMPENFGKITIEGVEPFLTPDQSYIVFRQGATIFITDLQGSALMPLIEDKIVTRLLGVVSNPESGGYSLLFSAQKPDIAIDDLWLATIQDNKIATLKLLPYSFNWFTLLQVNFFRDQMLYAHQTILDNGQKKWQIYLSSSSQEEGERLTQDGYNNLYPAWNLDGTKIIFVSDRKSE